MREKKTQTEDVLSDAGKNSLAYRFSRLCGQELIDNLSSCDQPCWKNGELILTPAYDLDKGPETPTHVIQFCLPGKWSGDHINQVNIHRVRDFVCVYPNIICCLSTSQQIHSFVQLDSCKFHTLCYTYTLLL